MIGNYFVVLTLVVFRRLIFPLVFIAIPFRAHLRNMVYNYHLQNKIPLKRLLEREPQLDVLLGYYYLKNLHSNDRGIIKFRKISHLEYYSFVFFWLLLDDDCNEDTYDKNFNETIVNGGRKKWIPRFIKTKLENAINSTKGTITGNSFDLGDRRAEYPLYEFWSVLLWTIRNPAYNFNYKFNQLCTNEKVFSVVIFNRLFGWWPDGSIDNIKCYNWEFGKRI